uniref:Uncharacterized protein n=1 Tax=Xiphophorus couchianus TaxID=32473 RepID=A0A3B5M278_9TELE
MTHSPPVPAPPPPPPLCFSVCHLHGRQDSWFRPRRGSSHQTLLLRFVSSCCFLPSQSFSLRLPMSIGSSVQILRPESGSEAFSSQWNQNRPAGAHRKKLIFAATALHPVVEKNGSRTSIRPAGIFSISSKMKTEREQAVRFPFTQFFSSACQPEQHSFKTSRFWNKTN